MTTERIAVGDCAMPRHHIDDTLNIRNLNPLVAKELKEAAQEGEVPRELAGRVAAALQAVQDSRVRELGAQAEDDDLNFLIKNIWQPCA